MRRNLYVRCGLSHTHRCALGLGSLVEKTATLQEPPLWRRGLKWIPVAAAAAQSLAHGPDHRSIRRCAGSRLVIHRAGSLEPGEQHATTNPPTAMCCRSRAAYPPIRSGRNLVGHWGGKEKATIARIQSRSHGRLQRQCLDRRKRPRPAPALEAPRGAPRGEQVLNENQTGGVQGYFNDAMILSSTQAGKFLMQIASPARAKAANDVEKPQAAGEDIRRQDDE